MEKWCYVEDSESKAEKLPPLSLLTGLFWVAYLKPLVIPTLVFVASTAGKIVSGGKV